MCGAGLWRLILVRCVMLMLARTDGRRLRTETLTYCELLCFILRARILILRVVEKVDVILLSADGETTREMEKVQKLQKVEGRGVGN